MEGGLPRGFPDLSGTPRVGASRVLLVRRMATVGSKSLSLIGRICWCSRRRAVSKACGKPFTGVIWQQWGQGLATTFHRIHIPKSRVVVLGNIPFLPRRSS